MTASLRSKVILNLLLANAVVLGGLAVWSEFVSNAQEKQRQDFLFQEVGERLQRFDSDRVGDLATIMTWSLWSEFSDALIVDQRFVTVDQGKVPVGVYLNPLGASHREPDYPVEEITTAMFDAVSSGASTQVAGGIAVPLKRASQRGEAWAGVFVRPKSLVAPLPFSWQVILAATFATIAAALLVWVLLRRAVLQPIEALAAASHNFAATRTPIKPSTVGVFEVDELLGAFSSMTTEISGFQDELQQQVASASQRAVDAERRAARHDRLAAMGTLAAGLAHEINSPLAGAINGVRVLQKQPSKEKSQRYGELVGDALERIAGLVARMLRLAPARPEGGQCQIEQLSGDLKDFVTSRLEKHQLRFNFPEQPLVVAAASGDLFPVMLNLLRNSLDSLDQSKPDGGVIDFSAVAIKDKVEIKIRDNGAGAAPEVLAHIFEPFVTDKEVGSGTGLGLALVHATITALGGSIEADNCLDGGFEVRLTLPACS